MSLTDFLSRRRKQVVIERCHSNPAEVTSGIPLNSVLGPLVLLMTHLLMLNAKLDYTQMMFYSTRLPQTSSS